MDSKQVYGCQAIIGEFIWGSQECGEPSVTRVNTDDGEKWICQAHYEKLTGVKE